MRGGLRRATPVLLALALTPALAQDLGNEAQRERGKELYDKYCSQCHGVSGDGRGRATPRVKPEPRDFTSGKYKFRTTPSGMAPTDADLRRVIKEGLPYTSMPGWPMFADKDVQNIIYYLKTFSDSFADPAMLADPIEIPEPPPIDEESVARGREVYQAQGCSACHGELGRGDGPSSKTLQDDWGNHLRPADLHKRWTFRGGPRRRDIFRTFSTGLNGTPMPSYGETLAIEDRWDLVNYIYSLADGDEPEYANLLIVQHIEDELDPGDPEALFAGAPRARFPLVGQIMQPGRNFFPWASSVEVRAVHNRREIALLAQWDDFSAETTGSNSPVLEVPPWDEDNPAAAPGGDEAAGDFWGAEVEEVGSEEDFWGAEVEEEAEAEEDFWGLEEEAEAPGEAFSDAVALQFPSQLPTGIRKPYFLFGDARSPVDLWFVDLANQTGMARQFVGRGSDAVEPAETGEIEVAASYDRGRWSVVFKRDLRSADGITFEEDRYVPLAFSVWDGFNRERGNKRALSSWFHLYVEPAEKISATGPMLRAAALTLLIEILLILYIRRRFSGRGAEAARPAPPVPERGPAA